MLLEVIALDARDARSAQDGGADRVELVSAMASGGLSPSPATVAAVRAAVTIPVRVMLRTGPGFAADLPRLRRTARDLRAAGAEEFVLGFLDSSGAVDPAPFDALLDGSPWTFHRAIDHAASRPAAWSALRDLPGLDTVLTAGSPAGVTEGLPVLTAEAASHARLLLAGGGVREHHLPALAAAGLTAIHSGSAARPGADWSAPVDAALVARLRDRLRVGA
ncbi:copper homeostasis protein CutC [Dactylosporangium sp. CA-139066]|uniref:copper homeostasis protein CutC n=1 Tax=Dactylosporangium sp. CA-139066 TaxID=3239930 RepID=UPI003D89E61F